MVRDLNRQIRANCSPSSYFGLPYFHTNPYFLHTQKQLILSSVHLSRLLLTLGQPSPSCCNALSCVAVVAIKRDKLNKTLVG